MALKETSKVSNSQPASLDPPSVQLASPARLEVGNWSFTNYKGDDSVEFIKSLYPSKDQNNQMLVPADGQDNLYCGRALLSQGAKPLYKTHYPENGS